MDVGGEIEEVNNSNGGGSACSPAAVMAVAVAKDRNSKCAVKWAVGKCMSAGRTLMLIHVRPRLVTIPTPMGNHVPIAQVREDAVAAYIEGLEAQTNEMLLPYRQMCNIKKVKSEVVVVEEDNIASAIVKQISHFSINKLVIGASSRNAITRRLKGVDVPTSVAKSVPNFCTVYVISRDKLTSVHSATSTVSKFGSLEDSRSLSSFFSDISYCTSQGESESESEYSPWFYSQSLPVQRNKALSNINGSMIRSKSNSVTVGSNTSSPRYSCNSSFTSQTSVIQEEYEINENRGSYLSRSLEHNGDGNSPNNTEEQRSHISSTGRQDFSPIQEATSSINSSVPSTQNHGLFETTTGDDGILDIPGMDGLYGASRAEADILDGLKEINEIDSKDNENRRPQKSSTLLEFNMMSTSESQMNESLSQYQNDIIFELQKLKLELKRTVGMYNLARQEAIDAKIKANELNLKRIQEARKLEAAKAGEEQARAIAIREKAKVEVALKQAEAARQLAERETLQRRDAEIRAIRELEERKKAEEALASAHRYRTYTLQEIQCATDFFSASLKIGEGGYGAVYKCILQHTTVAVKVLRPEATEGIQQFQQEVEVLSRIRHPHMVLLLGACPEHGCLVYEYMGNGSLEDRLLCKENTLPLPWFSRFRIAWEVASALLFLHSAKPKPIVHRDLKPANILIDSNLVSKIGDVGLARLVPAMTNSTVTEYKDTVPAGTFCYIDPEYQRTGTLGPKSDVYALGIMLLQLLTAKSPMAITYTVEAAIEEDSFGEILDKNAGDWPPEALGLAMLGLRCAELRRRDRPDLEKDILPELERLKTLAEAQNVLTIEEIDVMPPSHFFCPILKEVMEDPYVAADGFTYEYRAIETWLESKNTSPMTNMILDHKHLIPNHSLRSAILDWKSK